MCKRESECERDSDREIVLQREIVGVWEKEYWGRNRDCVTDRKIEGYCVCLRVGLCMSEEQCSVVCVGQVRGQLCLSFARRSSQREWKLNAKNDETNPSEGREIWKQFLHRINKRKNVLSDDFLIRMYKEVNIYCFNIYCWNVISVLTTENFSSRRWTMVPAPW